MINSLITSQTRIKLLRKFFLNASTRGHLRGLEAELGESTNSIRIELNRLEGAGLLQSVRDGNKKLYNANRSHPLFIDIHNIILKETGIDKVLDKLLSRIGKLMCVYLTGALALGKDSQVIELILIGERIDLEYLAGKVKQAENIITKKVNYKVITPEEAKTHLAKYNRPELFMLWSNEDEPQNWFIE